MVMTRRANCGIEIAVIDRGLGIPDEIADQLFKGKVKRDPPGKGLGMGLLMAEAIMETYDGRIRLGPHGSDGTEMIMWLPVGAAATS